MKAKKLRKYPGTSTVNRQTTGVARGVASGVASAVGYPWSSGKMPATSVKRTPGPHGSPVRRGMKAKAASKVNRKVPKRR